VADQPHLPSSKEERSKLDELQSKATNGRATVTVDSKPDLQLVDDFGVPRFLPLWEQ